MSSGIKGANSDRQSFGQPTTSSSGAGGGGSGDAGSKYEVSSNEVPQPNYNVLSEKLRKSTPSDVQCALFCGGKKCKYESGKSWSKSDQAIPGIYSHWVTKDVIAMSRPNMSTIQNTIQFFKENNIRTVINLQEPGEHASCGEELCSSGFSYEPGLFMEQDIYFYNFRWKDYSPCDEHSLLDIVKVMSFSLTEGKVAIHCHAGLGRTGVLISAYIVFALRCKPQEAIRFVRSRRIGAVQMRSQIENVYRFAQFIQPLFTIYPHVIPGHSGYKLTGFIQRRKLLLHGYEVRHLKHIPKILYAICERILKLCGQSDEPTYGLVHPSSSLTNSLSTDPSESLNLPTLFKSTEEESISTKQRIDFQLTNSEPFTNFFFSSSSPSSSLTNASNFSSPFVSRATSSVSSCPETSSLTDVTSIDSRSVASTSKTTRNANSSTSSIGSCSSSLAPVEENEDRTASRSPLMSIGMVGLDTPKVSRRVLHSYNLSSSSSGTTRSERAEPPSPTDSLNTLIERTLGSRIADFDTSPIKDVHDGDDFDTNDGDFDNFEEILAKLSINSPMESSSPISHDNEVFNDIQVGIMKYASSLEGENGPAPEVERGDVFTALLIDFNRTSHKLISNLVQLQREINTGRNAWERINSETNVEILSGLLWTWIENLSEPILGRQSIIYIVLKADKPIDGLLKLDVESRYTLEYLLRFIARLRPESEELLDILLKRFVAELAQQTVKVGERLIPTDVQWNEMRKLTTERVVHFLRGLYFMMIHPQ